MTISEQMALVDRLSAAYSSGRRLFYELDDQGKPEARAADQRTKELGVRIENLLKNLYGTWNGDVPRVKSGLTKMNTGLRQSIRQIERQVRVTQNVVKALGYLDDAIRVATRLIIN